MYRYCSKPQKIYRCWLTPNSDAPRIQYLKWSRFATDEAEQDYIHDKYMGELVKGIVHDETRSGLLNIIDEMNNNYDLQGLILGGTELPLILKQDDVSNLCLLDTTEIHVESILEALA